MLRLVLDAMGGDRGPRVILEGCLQALPELLVAQGELILVGDEKVLRPLLRKRRYRALRDAMNRPSLFKISLLPAAENIDMEDSVRAVRSKPKATINLGCQLAAESYLASKTSQSTFPCAFISAGHSGAIMASALLHMGRLPHVERPAIAVMLPTLGKRGCVLMDVGANVDCKPEHLRDFAVMAAIYAQVENLESTLPRVALLSNGEERSKGNELTRAAASLIENLKCFQKGSESIGQFVGYAEGKEIFRGKVDAVITDGFVGNVVLKSIEGLGASVAHFLKNDARRSPLTALGFLFAFRAITKLKRKLDYSEYGAAPLLGVAGYTFICHGRSNARAIKSALLHARTALTGRFVEKLEKTLISAVQPHGGLS